MGRPAWRFLKYGAIYSPLFGSPIDKALSGGHLVSSMAGGTGLREENAPKKKAARCDQRATLECWQRETVALILARKGQSEP
jgi:hypothetical protein